MAHHDSIIKQLDASRRLGSELEIEKHQQGLQRSRIEKELDNLSLSRRNYIQKEITQAQNEYHHKLTKDEEVSEDHLNRQKRATAERARIAQQDFEKDRERLKNERNEYDQNDKENRAVEKKILHLKGRSRAAQDEEDRRISDLNARKTALLKLLDDSKQRELYHYGQSKRLSEF